MPADQISSYLAGQGVGTEATDLFVGRMPDQPDALVCLFETPGAPLRASMVSAAEQRSLQARARAATYTAAQTRIEQVYRLLHGLHETDLDGAHFVVIEARQPPFSLGEDEKRRNLWVVNFRVVWVNPER